MRYELRAEGGETLLTFTHRGRSERNALGFSPGTHAFLDRLQAHLTGDDLPGWSERHAEVAPAYPAWRQRGGAARPGRRLLRRAQAVCEGSTSARSRGGILFSSPYGSRWACNTPVNARSTEAVSQLSLSRIGCLKYGCPTMWS
ncbi:hypothetical protein SAMN05216188_102155 [Lentzea xinjiangensis]|uniref:Activator of Hsp90 ATPase homolog 1-like protein n=1 Tax=Lentzea xinjiangensis TaxID=402600 RepID=A0A1H9DHH1_9PSEU|nr:hypothetical protein SAMN05216188_102155 [Lentzea xinjiangensis]